MDSEVASDIISATLSAAIATATSLAADPTATGPGGYNGTVPEAPPPYTEGNYVVVSAREEMEMGGVYLGL
jgi:hypothetical protein